MTANIDIPWCTAFMDEIAKGEAVIRWLTQRHLDIDGGYEYDCDWFGTEKPVLVIAALDPGKDNQRTKLDAYYGTDLVRWFDLAQAYAGDPEDMGAGVDIGRLIGDPETFWLDLDIDDRSFVSEAFYETQHAARLRNARDE